MNRILGRRVIWGMDLQWAEAPIANLPPDTIRVRRRFRADKPLVVFVRTPAGVTAHRAAPEGAALKLWEAIGLNGARNRLKAEHHVSRTLITAIQVSFGALLGQWILGGGWAVTVGLLSGVWLMALLLYLDSQWKT